MEKLVYINANDETLEFSAESEYRWQNVNDLGGLSAIHQRQSSPFQDGYNFIGDAIFSAKSLTVTFTIVSNDVQGSIREANRILNPRLGEGELRYTRGTDTKVYRNVKCRVLPQLSGDRANRVQRSGVIFDVSNPLLQSLAPESEYLATLEDLWSFPVEITSTFVFANIIGGDVSMTNDGDVPTPITGYFSGPLTSPVILENKTTDQLIQIDTSVASGKVLRVSTDPRNIEVKIVNADGSEDNGFQYINVANTEFFQLDPGENVLSFTSGGSSAEDAIVEWYALYVGV